jgi:hypothetical protein
MAPRKNPGACTAAGCASTLVRGAGCTARGRLRRASQSAPAPPGPRPSLQTAAARTRGTVSSACVGRGLVRNACRGLGDMPLSQGRRSTGAAVRAGQQQRLCVARVRSPRGGRFCWCGVPQQDGQERAPGSPRPYSRTYGQSGARAAQAGGAGADLLSAGRVVEAGRRAACGTRCSCAAQAPSSATVEDLSPAVTHERLVRCITGDAGRGGQMRRARHEWPGSAGAQVVYRSTSAFPCSVCTSRILARSSFTGYWKVIGTNCARPRIVSDASLDRSRRGQRPSTTPGASRTLSGMNVNAVALHIYGGQCGREETHRLLTKNGVDVVVALRVHAGRRRTGSGEAGTKDDVWLSTRHSTGPKPAVPSQDRSGYLRRGP